MSKQYKVTLSDNDAALIQAQAKAVGSTLSGYMRQAALEKVNRERSDR